MARGRVGRQDGDGSVEAPGPAQGGVDVPRRVSGGQDEQSFVVGTDAVHFHEELVGDASPRGAGGLAALLPDGVDLIEEEDDGRVPAGGDEQGVEVRFGVADELVEDVGEGDVDEGRTDLTCERTRDVGFAASRGAVEHESALEALAVEPAEFGIAQGCQERHVEAVFDVLHAADVGQGGGGGFDVPHVLGGGRCLVVDGFSTVDEGGRGAADLFLGAAPVEALGLAFLGWLVGRGRGRLFGFPARGLGGLRGHARLG